ncbi:hypothetical protein P689_119125 [Candidatus Riesia pediculischaeffi PTSU]|uniref:Uncharacterized protein n=1 Tax=Candidatus Riesia pediculischaeffi PTSU TaxID=1401651 RepID=A0A0C1V6T3_9ENTR|nr:hypothetical protein P689_119125 [Candidatus Riesia pediculischaeffi PTSU]
MIDLTILKELISRNKHFSKTIHEKLFKSSFNILKVIFCKKYF